MHKTTFHCEVLSPMFIAGADGTTPEIRPPSIRGMMRFWWRALHGHLSVVNLKKEEEKLFGGPDNKSPFSVRVVRTSYTISNVEKLVPHKPFPAFCIEEKSKFSVVLQSGFPNMDTKTWEKIQSIFIVSACLGGLGRRTRRGMGAFKIIEVNKSTFNIKESPDNLSEVFNYIQNVSSNYILNGNQIIYKTFGTPLKFGFLKKVELGTKRHKNLPSVISHLTHDTKKDEDFRKYESSMGYAFKGDRFSSPIYVSVLDDNAIPIISTLNTVPGKGSFDISIPLQENFKKRIL